MNDTHREKRRWIIHIDGDAFFASCEVARRPHLFGKPVVIGEERGIVTAQTYEAKRLGITRGMPIFQVRKSYPEVTVLSSHFAEYKMYAHNLAELLIPLVDEFEAYSIDECFASIYDTRDSVVQRVREIKQLIQSKLGITYSIGLSYNKTLAKIGSKHNKPNGFTCMTTEDEITKILDKTPIDTVWGIGPATYKKFKSKGIQTVTDAISIYRHLITHAEFARPVHDTLSELAGFCVFGVGIANPHQQSLQTTRVFLKKSNDQSVIWSELSRNVEIAARELYKKNLLTNRISVFFRKLIGEGSPIVYDIPLPQYTRDPASFLKSIENIMNTTPLPSIYFRGTGIVCNNLILDQALPTDLFSDNKSHYEAEHSVQTMIDTLRNRFGFKSIYIASSHNSLSDRNTDTIARHSDDNYIFGLPFPYLGEIS